MRFIKPGVCLLSFSPAARGEQHGSKTTETGEELGLRMWVPAPVGASGEDGVQTGLGSEGRGSRGETPAGPPLDPEGRGGSQASRARRGTHSALCWHLP